MVRGGGEIGFWDTQNWSYILKGPNSNYTQKMPSKKLKFAELVKKFLAFYETRRFVTLFTATGPYPKTEESSPHHPIFFGSILILYYHLCLDLTSGLFFSGLQNFVCLFHLSRCCYIPCPSHPPWFNHCVKDNKSILVTNTAVYIILINSLGHK
jgi:hypothetical protein